MRPILATTCLALSLGQPALAADLAAPRGKTVTNGRVLVCADAYCGQRKYPDPYIIDGWRGSDPRYDAQFDVRTWHLLRTMTPVYVAVPPGDRLPSRP